MSDSPWMLLALFVLGLLFGSFANVMVYRIPREIPLGLFSHRRSFCPHCKKIILARHNVPLFAYLWLKGRCAQCGERISPVYPTIEFLTGALFAFTYWVFVHAHDTPLENVARWAELAKLLYFTLSLIVVVFIDLEFRIIPDRFSLGNWIIATVAAVAWGSPHWTLSLAGSAFGFGSFFLLAYFYERVKKIEGLGFGDVKMMGWIGAWVGVFGVPLVILLASLSGLAAGLLAMRRSKEGLQTAIPFGPFLAAGVYAAWVLQSFGII